MRLISFFTFLIIYAVSGFAQNEDIRLFIFGHSLINHEPPAIPVPSNETTVPHWVYLLAQEANHTFAAGGQYGFLPQHRNTPPISQWGYDLVPGVWDSDLEPFSDANITTTMITAGNFIQYQPATENYEFEPPVDFSPLSATIDIIDWLDMQEDNIKVYIYENWPDMASFLNQGFPPTSAEFDAYNDFTLGGFHDWWIDYHDGLLTQRPDQQIKMIPVGPILSTLLSTAPYSSIPITELYEDDAPHGRATLYFLAGMISYMALYEEQTSLSYQVPDIIHPTVRDNYSNILNLIWAELTAFNDTEGNSRVFFNNMTTASDDIILSENCISILPNPTTGVFSISGDISAYTINILDASGAVVQTIDNSQSNVSINLNNLPTGLYFIRMIHITNGQLTVEKILKTE